MKMRVVSAIIFLFGVASLLVFATPQITHGAVGGGDGPGGDSGGAQKRLGWGWYEYSVDGTPEKPYWFRDGTTKWANVSKACVADGADKVMAFIVLNNNSGSEGNRGVVYKYDTGPFALGSTKYNGDNGGSWITEPEAHSRYESLPGPQKAGFTWGQNVAWFCYDSTPSNPEPKPVGNPSSGTGGYADCSLMRVNVSPGTDYNGNVVPVNVSTTLPANYGTYDTAQTIDLYKTHTTGKSYTVNFVETRPYISDYTEVKDAKGVIVAWNPVYSPARSWSTTVGPCYNYVLTPSTGLNVSGVIEPDAPITVKPSVSNTASANDRGHTPSKSTQWQISQIVVKPLPFAIPHEGSTGISDSAPCAYFAGPGVSCSMISSGSGAVYNPGVNDPIIPTYDTAAGDYQAGTRICYAYSVQPYASSVPEVATDARWAHSAPSLSENCLIVGKKPKIQIQGGDLMVGRVFSGTPASIGTRDVQTSTSTKSSGASKNTFGSWIEYGIFATGSIKGAGSHSAYAGPMGLVNPASCAPHRLSFTNAASDSDTSCSVVGGYKTNRFIPNVMASFSGSGVVLTGPASVEANSLIPAKGTFIGSYSGDVTLNPSTLAPGKSIILKVSGTVTIAGDQTYDQDNKGAQYTDSRQLPQLVIIANKIIINSNVTNVDAWLIANGTSGIIETCNVNSNSYTLSAAQWLTTKVCDKPLTINGPVMTKQLWLRRTAGSGVGTASGDPAEVFNLRPDAYFWAITQASGKSRAQTVYTAELPPRL